MAKTRKAGKKFADLIDEQLARYRSMRDFKITAEPSGSTKANARLSELPFVIQKHAASHLHYDFRLGWNGVLKSWAVAKGPSYNVKDKRLAVQVEDHPMEYGGFEGIIPKGQYGGGTVMLWDEGTWEPQRAHPDVDAGLRDGSLKFTLHGTKMQGNWALIRMGGKAANPSKPNWLLIKEHDSFERSEHDPSITDEAPMSVVTGRTMEEIALNEDHVWNSKDTATGKAWHRHDATPVAKIPKGKTSRSEPLERSIANKLSKLKIDDLPQERLPKFIAPQLALQATTPPDASGWVHELKLDGYRIQAHKDGSRVRLYTRSGLDWTHRMRTIAAEIAKLPVEQAIFDGEVVVLAKNGTTSFADLQASFQEGAKHELTYFLFDLLHINGHDPRDLPLIRRKEILAAILASSGEVVRLSEHLESNGAILFKKACELHAEGIVSKRASAKYVSGRTTEWLKCKCIFEQEFVIGGFTLPSNDSHGIGALLLGYFDLEGGLIYAGRTGTGFTQKTHGILRDKLDKLRTKSMPFEKLSAELRRGVIWTRPEMVAQVNFANWTADSLVRQASFKGIREDKPADEVLREEPAVTPKSEAKARTKSATHARAAAKSGGASSKADLSSAHAPVRLTHPDKLIDAESGLTKQQLADYYWEIADYMLPQIVDRPLSIVRCPNGADKPCFFQKHRNNTLPPGIGTIEVPDKKTGKLEPYITLSDAESLAGLAQIGVLEIHPWGSQNKDLEHPDRLIIDLDPDPSVPWKVLAETAVKVRGKLKKLGLESFLKSTGGKGLHVVAPIEPEYEWAQIKELTHNLALQMEKAEPALYVAKMSKAARTNRIYLDYLRNERGATAVAAFSPRARAGAPVSVPLSWGELKLPDRPIFNVAGFNEWKSRLKRNPWQKLPILRQRIDPSAIKQ